MKPLTHYEPTATDELLRKNATSENTLSEDYSALADHAIRLERKLSACREALAPFAEYEKIRKTMGGTTPKSGPWMAVSASNGDAEITVEDMQNAIETLAATAP